MKKMEHLTSKMPNNKTRIKMRYLRVFLNLYMDNGVLKTGFIDAKKEKHLLKLLKGFDAKLVNKKEHPSNKNINSFEIYNSFKLEDFLNKYINLKEPVWFGFKRVYDGSNLYFDNQKGFNYYKQPTESF